MDWAEMRSATWPAMLPRYPSSAIPDKYYYQEWHFLRPSRQSTFTLGVKPEKKTQKHAVSQLDIAIAWRTNQPRRKTWISYWMGWNALSGWQTSSLNNPGTLGMTSQALWRKSRGRDRLVT